MAGWPTSPPLLRFYRLPARDISGTSPERVLSGRRFCRRLCPPADGLFQPAASADAKVTCRAKAPRRHSITPAPLALRLESRDSLIPTGPGSPWPRRAGGCEASRTALALTCLAALRPCARAASGLSACGGLGSAGPAFRRLQSRPASPLQVPPPPAPGAAAGGNPPARRHWPEAGRPGAARRLAARLPVSSCRAFPCVRRKTG
jgi:hypothetical protein